MRARTPDVSLYVLPWRMQPIYFGSAATRPLDDVGERSGEINSATFDSGRSIAFKATREELLRVLGVASLKVVLSDGLLHDGVCIGCARVDIRDKLCLGAAVPPCAIASCSTSALLEDEWGAVQAVASLSLRLLDLGHSVLPHLITAPLQQIQTGNWPHAVHSAPSGHEQALAATQTANFLREEQEAVFENCDKCKISDRQLHCDAATGPEVVAADEPTSGCSALCPHPSFGSGVSSQHCRSEQNSHVPSDSSSRALPLPPLVSQDRWTIRGSSGEAPQPPPLFLSKA